MTFQNEENGRVAAVVVTYNRVQMLRQCLAALRAQSAPCDVLVVDNASTDDTAAVVQQLRQSDSTVYYRSTGANLGGAGGFNFGMRWAVEAGYRFVWVMDDDCFPKPDALENCCRTAFCRQSRQRLFRCFSARKRSVRWGCRSGIFSSGVMTSSIPAGSPCRMLCPVMWPGRARWCTP